MPAQLRVALSALVHAVIALIVSVLIARGVDIPAAWSAVAETALLAVIVAGYAALTHWLAGRKGDEFWPSAARWTARVLTLGAGALIPAPRPEPAAVTAVKAAPPPTT